MPPKAHMVHRTRRRMRLRVPEKSGDRSWFAQTAATLEQLDWVQAVECGPTTASLIIQFDDSDHLDERLAHTGLIDYQSQAPRVPGAAAQVKTGLARVDRMLKNASAGENDLRSMLFLVMLVLAGVQLARGKVMVPAFSLLWYAMQLALGARDQALTEAPENSDEQT